MLYSPSNTGQYSIGVVALYKDTLYKDIFFVTKFQNPKDGTIYICDEGLR
jgi:hypothetical protein